MVNTLVNAGVSDDCVPMCCMQASKMARWLSRTSWALTSGSSCSMSSTT